MKLLAGFVALGLLLCQTKSGAIHVNQADAKREKDVSWDGDVKSHSAPAPLPAER